MFARRQSCDRAPPPAAAAMICVFECTFCPDCDADVFGGICPDCGGEVVPRPAWPEPRFAANPPSSRRIGRDGAACAARRVSSA